MAGLASIGCPLTSWTHQTFPLSFTRMSTETYPSILALRARAGILGAVQCVALLSRESVSSQIGLPSRSVYNGWSVVQRAFESAARRSLTAVCAVSEIESAKASTTRKNDARSGPMLIVDTSYITVVPVSIADVGEKSSLHLQPVLNHPTAPPPSPPRSLRPNTAPQSRDAHPAESFRKSK
jgi:hypothetical protein